MTTIRPERLRGLALFADIDDRLLQRLAELMRDLHCPAGASVFAETDDRCDVYVVLRGRLRLMAYSQAGRETVFRDLHPGDMVGLLAAIDGGPRAASLVAVDNAELGQLEPVVFNRLLREEPAFARLVIDQLARQIRSLNHRLLLLAAPVPLRVCGELLRLAERCKVGENTARLAPPPKHLDLANRLNTHREAVSRTLAVLQRLGIIERSQGALLVRNIATLRRYFEGEPLPTRTKPSATGTTTVPVTAGVATASGPRPRAKTTTRPIRNGNRD
jgi:CRP/FNR family transcriptional regulator, cyclic AMP receptor protein